MPTFLVCVNKAGLGKGWGNLSGLGKSFDLGESFDLGQLDLESLKLPTRVRENYFAHRFGSELMNHCVQILSVTCLCPPPPGLCLFV